MIASLNFYLIDANMKIDNNSFDPNHMLCLQERVLEIEYIRAVVPRKEEEPSLHDDWVSAVDGSNPG